MELQQLRYVLAVAETRNFTRAAERCHVVQSALSHQLKTIERELGTPLFARSSRRVEVTAAGERFLVHAREALEAVERAQAAVTSATAVTGRLTLGLIPTVTGLDVPALLGEYHRAHPQVSISLRGGSSEELLRGLLAKRIDVAVLGLPGEPPARPGVATRELTQTRHVAVVSRRHRLAGRRRLTLKELAGEPFADFPADTAGRGQSDLAFRRAGLARSVVFEAVSPELICGLVEQDLAVALLPSAFLANRPGLAAVPVTHGPTRIEHLAWNDFNPSPASSAFLDLLQRDPAASVSAAP